MNKPEKPESQEVPQIQHVEAEQLDNVVGAYVIIARGGPSVMFAGGGWGGFGRLALASAFCDCW
jgi:hypothetical protein